jgi:hypothetical protein
VFLSVLVLKKNSVSAGGKWNQHTWGEFGAFLGGFWVVFGHFLGVFR